MQLETFTKRAVGAGLPSEKGAMLQRLFKADPKAAEDMLEQARVMASALKASGAFRELGTNGKGSDTAYDEIVANRHLPHRSRRSTFTR